MKQIIVTPSLDHELYGNTNIFQKNDQFYWNIYFYLFYFFSVEMEFNYVRIHEEFLSNGNVLTINLSF